MAGYIRNEDDSNAAQLTNFMPQSSGVFLAHLEQALPWLRENAVLSKDELGIIVVTSQPLETTLKYQAITIPCELPDAPPIIIAGTLVQFGEKQLKCVEGSHRLKDPACGSIAFTMWKADWALDDWTHILDSTTKFVVSTFAAAGCSDMIQSTWGRSLRNHNKVVVAAQATSVQIHGSVQPDHLLALLQVSGFNRIFCTPKGANGRQDAHFRIIWAQDNLPRLTSLSKTTSGCLGLVKARDGMGLRFKHEDFAAAWKVIHPTKEVPPDLQGAEWIKIQQLPFGTSKDMLIQWALTYKWKLQPIRSIGARAWLVASNESIPAGILLYNGAPNLAQLLPAKTDQRKSPIVAGSVTLSSAAAGGSQTGPPSVDPWAQYLAAQGRTVGPAPTSRSVVGPTETKFQEQEVKLQAMEVRLASMEASASQFQTETQKQITQLDTNIRQHSHDTQSRIHSIGLRFEEHQKEVAQQMIQCTGSGSVIGENNEIREPGHPRHFGCLTGDVPRKPWPQEG